VSTELTPSERSLRAQIASHTSWANTENRSERTRPARTAALKRFEKLVDPDGALPEHQRLLMAESARKAFYRRMAYKSAQARKRRGAMAREAKTHP